MTVVTTTYVGALGSGGVARVYITGTIAEVIQEICSQGLIPNQREYYSDNGTDAKALYCRRE